MSEPSAMSPRVPAPLTVRLVRAEERARWQQTLQQHHYLGCPRMVGQALWYVATVGGPVGRAPRLGRRRAEVPAAGCLDRLAPGPPVAAPALRRQQRPLLPAPRRGPAQSRLADSRAQSAPPQRATGKRAYGHPVLLAETFVDAARFRGTCYRAAGWQCLGVTRGFAKRNTGYVAHGHPKTVWVRPLRPNAVAALTAPFPPPGPRRTEEDCRMLDANRLPLDGAGGLLDLLQTVPDPRHRRGVRHPVRTVVALAVCAAVAGARSFTAIAQWARGLSPEALRRLGATRRTPPSEPTIRRVLHRWTPTDWMPSSGRGCCGLTAPRGARPQRGRQDAARQSRPRGSRPRTCSARSFTRTPWWWPRPPCPPPPTRSPRSRRCWPPCPSRGWSSPRTRCTPRPRRRASWSRRSTRTMSSRSRRTSRPSRDDIAALRLDAFPPGGHDDG